MNGALATRFPALSLSALLVSSLAGSALAAPPAGAASGAGRVAATDWKAVGDETARLLSGYVQIDTTIPPGNELAGARYLARFFDAQGIRSEVFAATPTRGSVCARLPATQPDPRGRGPILLLSHIDVVPAEPEAWSFPPFSGAIEDGHVYGRGALDDKGHGAVHAVALALLQRAGGARTRDVVACATAAEETGDDDAIAVGAQWMIEHHWNALGPPAVVWNEGGWATPTAVVGGRIVNAIATTEKRAVWPTLSIEGEGGHGSRPFPGTADDRLVRALARVLDAGTPLRITPAVATMFDRLAPSAAFPLDWLLPYLGNPVVLRLAQSELEKDRVVNALVRDTIALTGLRSGVKHNVIPRFATATLDIRLLPDTDAVRFVAWLRTVIADEKVRIEDLPDPLPPVVPASPTENDLFVALEAELSTELPGSISVPLLSTGGTDSKWFRLRGVPSYGFFPLIANDALVATMHGLDERVPVGELARAVRITVRTLERLTRP